MIPRLKYLLSTILFSFSLKPTKARTTPFLYSTAPRLLPRPRPPLRSPTLESRRVESRVQRSNERLLRQSTLAHSIKCSSLEKEEPGYTFPGLSSFVTINALIRAKPTRQRIPTPHSDLVKVVQSVRLAPAPLQVSQLQLQGLQAAGAQRAAEQLQEKRAGNHACQLVQQPLASCRVGNE